ncbi:MAG: hypothetical protein ICV62_04875 [Cyanobacteria bacterium Co-bin13]|nr:hypothetical protein [Cyanobacteria bacterium Co-bin13]
MKSTAQAKWVRQPWFVNSVLRNGFSTPLLALVALVLSLLPMAGGQAATPLEEGQPAGEALLTQASTPTPAFPANGVYLYGQVPEADQVGMGYMVFESDNQRLVGALYMPNSSFDCFRGEIQGTELAMMITNSYTQEVYPYGVALVTEDAIASSAGSTLAPLNLDGFHQLPNPSENDLRILETCKANLQL